MVECNLAKVDVAGSNPVSRSTKKRRHTQVAKGEVCKTFMLRFESGCRLHYKKAQYALLGLFMSHDPCNPEVKKTSSRLLLPFQAVYRLPKHHRISRRDLSHWYRYPGDRVSKLF